MQRARRALSFCYLCGGPLRTTPALPLSTEHVFPLGALDARPKDTSWWPVTLRVHARCEEEHKKPHDAQLITQQRANVHGTDRMSPSEQAVVRKLVEEGKAQGLPDGVSALPGWAPVRAVRQAVRGLHAALYGEYLPATYKGDVYSPAPGFNLRSKLSIERQLDEDENTSSVVFALLEAARMNDEWDGIVAWGGNLRYRCVWHRLDLRPGGVMCMWTLDTPESRQWSKVTAHRDWPWRGAYLLPSPPARASILTDAAIEKLVDERILRVQQPLLKLLPMLAGQVPPWASPLAR